MWEAERKMGEMLLAEAKAGRLATKEKGRPIKCTARGHLSPMTTVDLGITRKERAEAQTLARVPLRLDGR